MASANKKLIDGLLAEAGITPGGGNAWDITIKNPKLHDRVITQGSLGLGEAYMQGWWECQQLDAFFYRLFSSGVTQKLTFSWPLFWAAITTRLFNLQSKGRSFEVGVKHYDLGNAFFSKMLGKSMVYSCGYWKDATNIDDAQFAKLDLICRKLNLQKGPFDPSQGKQQVRILDIGSGWGGFAKYAAEHYGVSVVGVTVSKEQLEFAKESCKGLPVEFRLQDYRELNEQFDHIVSVGMFEHVGVKNYRTYLEVAKRCLKKDGLFLLHTIGASNAATNTPDPWLTKYIFPNGSLPLLQEIAKYSENLFIIEDVHNFGAYYDKTLMAWHENFKQHWPEFKDRYGDVFFRMWEYYLLSLAASFRNRDIELWQIVLSPHGVKGGYNSVR